MNNSLMFHPKTNSDSKMLGELQLHSLGKHVLLDLKMEKT